MTVVDNARLARRHAARKLSSLGRLLLVAPTHCAHDQYKASHAEKRERTVRDVGSRGEDDHDREYEVGDRGLAETRGACADWSGGLLELRELVTERTSEQPGLRAGQYAKTRREGDAQKGCPAKFGQ